MGGAAGPSAMCLAIGGRWWGKTTRLSHFQVIDSKAAL
jgi:hypothetical protein